MGSDLEQASSREVAARPNPPVLAAALLCPLSLPRTHTGAKAWEGATGTLALQLHPHENKGSVFCQGLP